MSSSMEKNVVLPLAGKKDKYGELVQEMFSVAGVSINGNRSFDIQVKDPRFFRSIIRDGTLGLGESYMDQWWECEDIAEMFSKVVKADLMARFDRNIRFIFYFLKAKLSNEGRRSKAFEIGKRHYDAGNDLFQNMLDPRMVYSCGYWKNAQALNQAQEDKLDLICKKIDLEKGMRVLDIGCGWGSFAKFASEKYGVEVVGVTVSKEQVHLAKELCSGLPIEIRLQDYRDLNEKFDRIVSVGMFEHVCPPNYDTYMNVVSRCLKEDGLFLLHTIGRNKEPKSHDGPWIRKYIFPNSEIPSIAQVAKALEGVFVMEDWQNFGTDYEKTLIAWYQNLVKNWKKIQDQYDQKFFRMMEYWLLMSVGLFRARFLNTWQLVLSKHGIPEGYQRKITYSP
ncbi:MAG: cyclopropane fatty acyl phospholipid synthase [bacterium]|nr:cyclopropane fatty acyl phospholipid synthase [bacterium]